MMATSNRLYHSIYKSICAQNQIPLNKAISSGLQKDEFLLDASQLTPKDIVPLQMLLSVCPFKLIYIQGKQHKQQGANPSDFASGIIHSIKLNLGQPSFQLLTLQIKSVSLCTKDVKQLGEGLIRYKNLKELYLINCRLSCEHVQLLSEAIIQCHRMIVLDLSRNHFKSEIGLLIGRLVQEHGKRRDACKESENAALAGLCEINLNKCGIKSSYLKDLLLLISKDNWIKSLGLASNQIDEEGIKMLNAAMEHNRSLISLDLRKNPGFSEDWSKLIYDKLVRNLGELQVKRSKKKKKSSDKKPHEEEANQTDHDPNEKAKESVVPEFEKTLKTDQKEQKDPLQFGSLDLKCTNCHRIQSDSLRLQYEAVNLQMQLRQLNDQLYRTNDEDQPSMEEVQEYERGIREMSEEIQEMMEVLEGQKFGLEEMQ